VTIDRDRILRVGALGQVATPPGARVIDGRGKYLVPGFIDTHAHVAFGPVTMRTVNGAPQITMTYDHGVSRETLATLLAFGVTTVRNPAAPAEQGIALRDSLERNLIPGPRVRTAGETIEVFESPGLGKRATTPDAVRAEVARQAALGVDYVKLYAGLSAPLVRAGVDEAKARRVKAITHTMVTTWTDAANAGVHGIVHVVPGSPRLVPSAQRAAYLASMRGTQFMAEWFRYADFDSPEIRTMIEALVRHGTWLDLTLVTFDAMFRGDEPSVTQHPDLRFAHPAMVTDWGKFALSQGWSASDFASAKSLWPRVEQFVRQLHAAGVRLTVGTDANNPWVAPGISLHREMALMVRAGIPATEVLRMATLSGAESLGLQDEIGTVDAGKRADLVLLDADPLADIANTRRIALVVRGGRVLAPAEVLPARLQPGAGDRRE
jgi:imidazolonepropionase-like amidohydrolase